MTNYHNHGWRATVQVVLMAVFVLGTPAVAYVPDGGSMDYAAETDQLIVKLRRYEGSASEIGISATQLGELRRAAGVELRPARVIGGDARVLRLARAMDEDAVALIADRLAELDSVEFAEPDRIMRPTLAPDDARYAEQWHYFEAKGGANLPAAWDITTGDDAVVVAVLDTGILFSHIDLLGKTVPGYDFISDASMARDGNGRDADASDEGDWVERFGSVIYPSSWHGTHVAGTVGAATNNGTGVAGVNWDVLVQPVRVLGSGGGFTSDIADAIRWASGNNVSGVAANLTPARVINMSLGGGGACGTTFQSAIDAAIAKGTVVVVAAGNESRDASQASPGNCNGVITVAATDRNADLAWYSNFGSLVEISAPGGDTSIPSNGVLSTLDSGVTIPANDSSYAFYQGTSMAAPHVAGIAALILGEEPNLTPSQVSERIQDTARAFPFGSDCTIARCGAGIIDAAAALHGGSEPGGVDLAADDISTARRYARVGRTLRFDWDMRNLGDDDFVGDVGVNLFLSTDTTLSGSDTLIASATGANFSIPAGSSLSVFGEFAVSSAPRGRYYVIVEVDPNDLIDESNETNNVSASSSTLFVF